MSQNGAAAAMPGTTHEQCDDVGAPGVVGPPWWVWLSVVVGMVAFTSCTALVLADASFGLHTSLSDAVRVWDVSTGAAWCLGVWCCPTLVALICSLRAWGVTASAGSCWARDLLRPVVDLRCLLPGMAEARRGRRAWLVHCAAPWPLAQCGETLGVPVLHAWLLLATLPAGTSEARS